MLETRSIREDFEATVRGLARRGVERAQLEELRSLDRERRALIARTEELRACQRSLSKRFPSVPHSEQVSLREELTRISEELANLEPQLTEAELKFNQLFSRIPNLPDPEAPDGMTEEDAVPVSEFGTKRGFDFEPLDHLTIGERLGMVDVTRAVKVSGSRFAYITGDLALLEFALLRYAWDRLIAAGFRPMLPPVLAHHQALFGTGYFPEGEDQIYAVEKDELYLIGTAEVTLAAYHMDEILDENALPVRFSGFTTCFRREAGASGRDTRGIIRTHQFDKLEMFSFVRPEESSAEHERMVQLQVDIISGLDLYGRVVDIAVGDLGPSAARKHDLEVWLVTQGQYREVTSASNCTDYQARRLKTRYRDGNGRVRYVHTLNATGCAIGRTLVAILETHQRNDGSVDIPMALRPYFAKDRLVKA
jgi:seryl-tRNA synthetase